MDLSSAWGKAQQSWNDYRNPTISDDQMYGLGMQSDIGASYQPWGNAETGFMPDFGGLGSGNTNLVDFGQANPMQAAWTKFQDSSFKDQISAIGSTVNAASSAYNAYNSVKLGKQQLGLQKDAWNKQYSAQRSTTNAAMADRQAARVASNPNYQSVDSYMNKYGIK